jgi:hypothetical protein
MLLLKGRVRLGNGAFGFVIGVRAVFTPIFLHL